MAKRLDEISQEFEEPPPASYTRSTRSARHKVHVRVHRPAPNLPPVESLVQSGSKQPSPGWLEKNVLKLGLYFYDHPVTGASSWTPPEGVVPPRVRRPSPPITPRSMAPRMAPRSAALREPLHHAGAKSGSPRIPKPPARYIQAARPAPSPRSKQHGHQTQNCAPARPAAIQPQCWAWG